MVQTLIDTQLSEFKDLVRSKSESVSRKPDRATRKLLLYLFTGTKGGYTRLKIVMHLEARSFNTHQLSKEIGLDYKAIQHHMKVLEKNNLVTKVGEKYGAIFHLSNFLEINIACLGEVIEKLERKMNTKKVYY
ncbi:MAG TPA: winged helix-turn-helix domain-containing protein [Nitrosopumilaceae archaeon]|nr:winged helix-turn-helix domain-containing protein [Nitrosopumilaceae archaeon]